MTSASRNVLLLWFEQRRGVGIRDERCFCLRRLFLVAAAVGDADRSMAMARGPDVALSRLNLL